MRLYRLDDTGEPVRDIQDRLSALGFDSDPDGRGEFRETTRRAVMGFQQSRGLAADGVVGPETWRALYEAGYRLGDRLLFLRRPMFRGEDVAEFQARLSNLGFDPGKTDGVFGQVTERALTDFQHNRALPEDGVAGPEVITELRLVTRASPRTGRETVREREWLRSLRPTVVGTRVFFDASGRTADEAGRSWEAATAAAVEFQARGGLPLISRTADVIMPERVRATRANRLGADLIVGFQLAEPGQDGIFFFETTIARSVAGSSLASYMAGLFGQTVAGRGTALLRETRAPAVIISRCDLGAITGQMAVDGLERFFQARGRPPG